MASSNGQNSQTSPLTLSTAAQRKPLGTVVRGSLQAGLQIKVSGDQSVEEIRAGKFVVIEGDRHEFFAMITDVALDCVSPQILADPPSPGDTFMRQVLTGTAAYGTVMLKPLLMRARGAVEFEPVKTVPAHFSGAGEATVDDIADIFGAETEGGNHFHIGAPIDMADIQVCLDLGRFVERSN